MLEHSTAGHADAGTNTPPAVHSAPQVDAQAAPLFLVNAASGSAGEATLRAVIAHTLTDLGRSADVLTCGPGQLATQSNDAVAEAVSRRSWVVAVGGDGTLNTVAQAAHRAGCPMGVVPTGTFNYFARAHLIPTAPEAATRLALLGQAQPVQVAALNERLFLVNASLGLYPDLLEDREAYKARFGRSRAVALWAGLVTLLRAQRQLRLHIEHGRTERDVRTLTLFVGNNPLQLAQLGLPCEVDGPGGIGRGSLAAIILKPIGTGSMLRLMWHGALGTLGAAEQLERFSSHHLVVRPSLTRRGHTTRVAFDGEVTRMRDPLDFRVLERPLYLIKPSMPEPTTGTPA